VSVLIRGSFGQGSAPQGSSGSNRLPRSKDAKPGPARPLPGQPPLPALAWNQPDGYDTVSLIEVLTQLRGFYITVTRETATGKCA
jgi:hypothetical protein